MLYLQVCFWLVENGFRVLIAACDTFRAGAVEQLRTHVRKLNALHPPERHGGQQAVQLYEKGYGKDAAGIAMEAINYGKCTLRTIRVIIITVVILIIIQQWNLSFRHWSLVRGSLIWKYEQKGF